MRPGTRIFTIKIQRRILNPNKKSFYDRVYCLKYTKKRCLMIQQKLTRRNFVKSVVAASAVYSLMPSRVLGANERVNVGVLGLGGKGLQHLEQFGNLDHVEVIAVSDPDESRMDVEGYQGAKHRDYRHLLEMKEVDAGLVLIRE